MDYTQIVLPQASSFILLDTLWNQSGPISTGGSIDFNQYCPIIPSTNYHAVTGCTATMAGQMMYYWMNKTGFAPQITVASADAYTVASTNIVINGTVAGAAQYGYLDFASLNKILSNPTLSGPERDKYIAALNFAIGVKGKANYSSGGTSIVFSEWLFKDVGYDSVKMVYYDHAYFYANGDLTKLGWEIMVDNLTRGLPIATCNMDGGHAVVTDGYDASSNKVHVNFGWGNNAATNWYSLEDFNESITHYLIIDVFPVYDGSAFTVSDTREYGVGTLQRVLEQTNALQNKNAVITFSATTAGEIITVTATGLYSLKNSTTISNWNANVYTTLASYNYGLRSTGQTLTITNFTGSLSVSGTSAYGIYSNVSTATITIGVQGGILIANASAGYSYGIRTSAVATSVSIAGGVVFGGTYSVSGKNAQQSTLALTNSLWGYVNTGAGIATGVLAAATGYAFYGGAGDDAIRLDSGALMLGNIALFAGKNTITMDSTAKVYGSITGSNIEMNMVIAGQSSGAILNLTASGGLSGAAFTINLDEARNGIYTLIQSSVALSWLASTVFKVVMDGATYSIKTSDTFAQFEFADFTLTNNTLLTLEVKTKKYNGRPIAATDKYSVTISWEHDAQYASYTLKVDDKTYTVTGNTYTINNVSIGSHTYQLMGHYSIGESSTWSTLQTFQILDSTPPVLNGLPVAAIVGAYSATISWSAATDNVAVAGYILKVDNLEYDVKSLSHTLTGMALGNHIYQLQAYDALGNKSAWSALQSFSLSADYQWIISGAKTQTQTAESNVLLARGANISGRYPAALQVLGDGFNVTLAGDNVLSCASIRNAAILFGDDAYWTSSGPHYDGTVTFKGNNITLFSSVSACITAAGIVGKNLTVNFAGDASGAKSIVFESTNGANAGNYAYGIKADQNLTINGDFGGTVNCHFDFSNASSNRDASLYGFSAGANLAVNGDISGSIFLSGIGATSSYAYGLQAKEKLTVSGEISGTIAVTAQNKAYAVYAKNIDATFSGSVFAGLSSKKYDMNTLLGALEDFSNNKNELLTLASGHYAVYATGASTLRFNRGALIIGDIYLGASGSSIFVNGNTQFHGNISTNYSTALTITLSGESLAGTRLNLEIWNARVALTVNASGANANGDYSLAAGTNLTALSAITLTVASKSQSLSVGGSVVVNNATYSLVRHTQNGIQEIVLSVSGIDLTPPTLNGVPTAVQNAAAYTATITWKAATDNVGVAGYELKIGDRTYTVNTTSHTSEALAIGTHTYSLRAFDAMGNYSAWSAEQQLIIVDALPPVITVNADVKTPTNSDVMLTVTFHDDVAVATKQYKIGPGSWCDYLNAIAISANTTVYFRATDTAGNTTETQYTVANIDKEKPTITNIVASTTAITNQNVIVSAHFSDNASLATQQYRIDNGAWLNYTNGATMTANGTVYFKAVDAAGNETVAQCTVGNIDKVAPAITNIVADRTSWTNQNVTVTAQFTDNVSLATRQYKIDSGSWQDYTGGVTMTANGTIYFRATDTAGNETNAQHTISNIDKIAPDKPEVMYWQFNAEYGLASAVFSDDSVRNEYSFDNVVWNTYSGRIAIDRSRTIFFRSTDAAGNASSTEYNAVFQENYGQANIQIVLAEAQAQAAGVTLSWTVTSASAGVAGYRVIYSRSSDFSEFVVVDTQSTSITLAPLPNGQYYWKLETLDLHGNNNITDGNSFVVWETVLSAPSITASSTKPTNQAITLSARFSSDSVLNEYSFDRKNWYAYTNAITISENRNVYFRSTDAAGQSSSAVYTVENIDITPPEKPTITLSNSGPTREIVTLSVAFAADSVKNEYSSNGKTFRKYTGPLLFSSNATYTFRSTDAAGNETSTSYTVSNIQAPDGTSLGDVFLDATLKKYNAVLKWKKPAVFTADVAPAYYEIYCNGEYLSTRGTSLTLKDLALGEYDFFIRAVDTQGGRGAWSPQQTLSVTDVTAPTVKKLTTLVQGYVLDITWMGEDKKGSIVSYTIKYDGSVCAELAGDVGAKQLILTETDVGKHTIEVIAFDGVNYSKAAKKTFTVKDTTPPEKVIGLSNADVSDTKYTTVLSWIPAEDNSGVIARYWIEIDGKQYKSTTSSFKATKLSVGEHTYRVRAVDKAGNLGAWSDSVSFMVYDVTPPGKVSLKLKVTENDVALSWKALKDNVGVVAYEVWTGASAQTMELYDTLNADQFNIQFEDRPKGDHFFGVRGIDAAGNIGDLKIFKAVVKTELAVASELVGWQDEKHPAANMTLA